MPTPEEVIALLPLYGQTPSCLDGIGMERAFRLTRALDAAGYEIREKAPEGWVTVPKEPTDEMAATLSEIHSPGLAKAFYRAMLAAAPDTKKAGHPSSG